MGNPTGYDIDIIRGPIDDYFVQPIPPRSLNASELETQSKVDKDFLLNNVKPYPVECVKNFMRRYGL